MLPHIRWGVAVAFGPRGGGGEGVTAMDQYLGEGRFIRQESCPSHYGYVRLVAEPATGDAPFALLWQVDEATIPAIFADEVRDGVLQSLAEARWATPLRVAIIGGGFHPIDSQHRDYREAALRAMRQALALMAQESPE